MAFAIEHMDMSKFVVSGFALSVLWYLVTILLRKINKFLEDVLLKHRLWEVLSI
jgi:hypothetical protein